MLFGSLEEVKLEILRLWHSLINNNFNYEDQHYTMKQRLCFNKCRACGSAIKVRHFDIGFISLCFVFDFVCLFYRYIYHHILLLLESYWAYPRLWVGFGVAEQHCFLEQILQRAGVM